MSDTTTMGHGVIDSSSLGFVLRFVSISTACISVFTCGAAAAGGCGFPAIFAFGTSLSDTGNGVLSNPLFKSAVQLPYGETYFGREAGRFCDGRLMIDFLAQSVGLPFLKPYLAYKTTGMDFSQGINYAVAGATVQRPVYLLAQGNFAFLTFASFDLQMKRHLSILQAVQSPEFAASSYPGVTLPTLNAVSKALYFIELGSNDYGTYFVSKYGVRPGPQRGKDIDNSYALSKVVPEAVQKLVSGIEELYANNARNFFILNALPEGCAAFFLKLLNGTKDVSGCLTELNEVDTTSYQLMSAAANVLRSKYSDINVLVADSYSPFMKVVQNPSQYGFSETLNACCGAGPSVSYQFQISQACSPSTFKCSDPSSYVFWDGIHPTDAMNRYIVNSLVSGPYITPSGLACASSV